METIAELRRLFDCDAVAGELLIIRHRLVPGTTIDFEDRGVPRCDAKPAPTVNAGMAVPLSAAGGSPEETVGGAVRSIGADPSCGARAGSFTWPVPIDLHVGRAAARR